MPLQRDDSIKNHQIPPEPSRNVTVKRHLCRAPAELYAALTNGPTDDFYFLESKPNCVGGV